MEDSTSLNKINVDDDEEEEINTTHCPYKKVTNFLGGFFGGKNQTNDKTKLSTEDEEKPKCPFGFTSSKNEEKPKCPFGFTSSNKTSKGRCPFGFGAQDDNTENNNKINSNKENEKNASDDGTGIDERIY